MTQYIAKVKTIIHQTGEDLTRTRLLIATADSVQKVKEQYHRYIHENYEWPSRAREDEHTHRIHQTNVTISLEGVKRLDETWLTTKEVDDRIVRV